MTSKATQFAYFKNLNISTTKQETENAINFRLIWKCCSVTFEIGSTNFSVQWHFKVIECSQF